MTVSRWIYWLVGLSLIANFGCGGQDYSPQVRSSQENARSDFHQNADAPSSLPYQGNYPHDQFLLFQDHHTPNVFHVLPLKFAVVMMDNGLPMVTFKAKKSGFLGLGHEGSFQIGVIVAPSVREELDKLKAQDAGVEFQMPVQLNVMMSRADPDDDGHVPTLQNPEGADMKEPYVIGAKLKKDAVGDIKNLIGGSSAVETAPVVIEVEGLMSNGDTRSSRVRIESLLRSLKPFASKILNGATTPKSNPAIPPAKKEHKAQSN